MRIAERMEMIERHVAAGHSVEWAEWWVELNAWWPWWRRVTKAEERAMFLIDGGETVDVEVLSLGLG